MRETRGSSTWRTQQLIRGYRRYLQLGVETARIRSPTVRCIDLDNTHVADRPLESCHDQTFLLKELPETVPVSGEQLMLDTERLTGS